MVLASGNEALGRQEGCTGRRPWEGWHGTGVMTGMKSEWLQSHTGRQERVAGEEQSSLADAEFLLISDIVPLSFVFTAGCSLLPTRRMRTAFPERSSLPASL